MNAFVKSVALLSVVLIGASCSRHPSLLEQALILAGDNRIELERVIAHYDSIGDDEKVEAVRFLIANMPGCVSAEGAALDRFYEQLDSVYSMCEGDFRPIMSFYHNTLEEVPWEKLRKRQDIKTVSADYLIRNIDRAFEVRTSPFMKDVSFREFCETVLPHRVSDEVLEDWSTDYREHLAYSFEGVDLSKDSAIYQVFWQLTQGFKSYNYNKYPADMPSLKPSFLRRSILAPCSDFCKMSVFWGRTFGVPVVHDFIPQWVNYPNRHEWNAVLFHGKSINFMVGERNYLGDHLRKCSNIMTKVYRHRYAFQSESEVAPAYSPSADVPPFFRNPKMIDVTSEYWPVIDIPICGLKEVAVPTPFVYLTVFDNKDWSAIAWARKEGDDVAFKNVAARPALYLPAYYVSGKYVPASSPIRVGADSSVVALTPDTAHLRSVRLTRKYYEMRVRIFLLSFTGSTIQVANTKDFSDAKSFVIPDTIGTAYQDWNIEGSYRYVRFLPVRGKGGSLAELEAYNAEGQKVKARVIGHSSDEETYPRENVADGDELTFVSFSKKDTTEWVGLDLGQKVPLTRVSYLCRNDGNFIVEGNEYELFYWDGGWVSLGRQTGTRATQALVFENVPSGALLLLRNHTKGKEERIFTYEGGKQVWW